VNITIVREVADGQKDASDFMVFVTLWYSNKTDKKTETVNKINHTLQLNC